MTVDEFFKKIKEHYLFIQYTLVRHFNISLSELMGLDINFIYDMMYFFRREEKSKEFIQMSLAGVDLSKSASYRKFIEEDIKPEESKVDMSDMEGIKELSLTLLKGGKSG